MPDRNSFFLAISNDIKSKQSYLIEDVNPFTKKNIFFFGTYGLSAT